MIRYLITFINYREEDLADLIFHEPAHHHLFVKGDTTFNESFATAFAQSESQNGPKLNKTLRRWKIIWLGAKRSTW